MEGGGLHHGGRGSVEGYHRQAYSGRAEERHWFDRMDGEGTPDGSRLTLRSRAPVKAKAIGAGAQTVDRALQLLECFTPARRTLSLSELSALTGLTAPTAHRLLKALQRRQFVASEPRSRRYTLGLGAVRLADVVLGHRDFHHVVLPYLEHLRELTGETVALHWFVDDHQVCVTELVSPQAIRMASGVGRRYPLHSGASGKALLACLEAADVRRILADAERTGEGLRGRTVEELNADLATIRKRGYATSRGEIVDGAAALAAPILDRLGRPVAAINITGPAYRWSASRMRAMAPKLVTIIREIEEELGAPSPVIAG